MGVTFYEWRREFLYEWGRAREGERLDPSMGFYTQNALKFSKKGGNGIRILINFLIKNIFSLIKFRVIMTYNF